MGVKASKVRGLVDTDAGVTLRNVADGAETATATETAISLKELDTAYWHDNEIPHGTFEVFVNVTALDLAQADETYTISLVVDDTANLSDTPEVILSFAVKRVGVYRVLVDSKSIALQDPETSGADKWLAIRATLAGTSPSITYGAWIAKNFGA